MNYKTRFALCITIFFWASAFVGIRSAVAEFSPEGLGLLRYLIATVCMMIVYWRLPQRNLKNIRDIISLLGVGAIGIGIYNIAVNRGEIDVSSGMASFIASQSPIVATILALIFLNEKLTLSRIFGFIVSIIGIGLIAIGESGDFHFNNGIYYLLLAAAAAGSYAILQKPFLKKYHAIETTTFTILGGTLFLCFYAPQLHQDLAQVSSKAIFTVMYLGVFPGALSYVAWAYVLKEIPAARAVSFLYFMPFVATILGWVCLSEIPAWISIGGGILAMVGVGLVNKSYKLLVPVKEKAAENSLSS